MGENGDYRKKKVWIDSSFTIVIIFFLSNYGSTVKISCQMVKKEVNKNPAPRRSIRKTNSNNGGKKAAIVTPPKKLVRFVLWFNLVRVFS